MGLVLTRGRASAALLSDQPNKIIDRRTEMKINQIFKVLSIAVVLALAVNTVSAQEGGDRPRRSRDGQPGEQAGGPGGGRNFDPAEMQKRMLDYYKETLEITDETEWKALEPMITKVSEARRQTMSGMGRGMFGGRGGRGGPGGQTNPKRMRCRKRLMRKPPMRKRKPRSRNLAARKAKQADLEKAQADLRKVLTPRQEAIATLNGLL
jgi:hypothetical protein